MLNTNFILNYRPLIHIIGRVSVVDVEFYDYVNLDGINNGIKMWGCPSVVFPQTQPLNFLLQLRRETGKRIEKRRTLKVEVGIKKPY